MSRAPISYRERRAFEPAPDYGVDPETPVAGYYRMRLRNGGAHVGVRIWYGPPRDPVTGEEMDRSWRWQALRNEEPIDIDRVWPACAREVITEIEYNRLCSLIAWARRHAPESQIADPKKPNNPLKNPLPF
jgi:hypothetical protein